MTTKILGILICTLLIATGVPTVGAVKWTQTQQLLASPVTVRVTDDDNTTGMITKTIDLSETNFEIDIQGGLGIKAVITNHGTSDAKEVPWQIYVEGGILRRFHKTMNGTIDIPTGGSISVGTGIIFEFGPILIITKVADEEQIATGIQIIIFSIITEITHSTLWINIVGNGTVTPPSGSTYMKGTIVDITATPDTGWQFDSWSGDVGGTINKATITMDADKTVTATFTETCYTLMIYIVGSGTVTPPPGTPYPKGTVVNIRATPASGWQFDSWSGDLTGNTNPTTITMDNHKTILATFTQIKHTLTINTIGSGLVTKTPDQPTYHYHDIVQLTAIPDTGCTFTGWSGDLIGDSNPDSITITGNTSVTATFTEFSPAPPYNYPEDTYHLIYGDVTLEPTWENLQYAMDNAGNEIIFLPEGTIWVEGRMYPKENNRIIGRGQSKSVLESNREVPTNAAAYMIPLWLESTANNVELGYFSIKMHQNGSNAINIYSDHCHVHHINIYEAGFNGLYTPGASYLLAHDINCYNGINDPGAGCHGFAFGAIDNSTTYNLSVYGWSSGFDYYARYVNAWNLYGENLTGLTMKSIQGNGGINPHHCTFRNIELHAKDGYDPDGFKIYDNSFCTYENIKCDRFYTLSGYNDHDNTFRNITITGDYGLCDGFSISGSNHNIENIYVEGSRIYGFAVNGNNIIARNIHVNGHLSYNRITGNNIELYDSIFEGGINTQEMVISPSGGTTDGLIIDNTIFRNCNSNGVDIDYATNFQITHCSVLHCADAIRVIDENCNNFVIKYNYFCWNSYNGVVDNTPVTANKDISENEVC